MPASTTPYQAQTRHRVHNFVATDDTVAPIQNLVVAATGRAIAVRTAAAIAEARQPPYLARIALGDHFIVYRQLIVLTLCDYCS